MAGSFIAQDLAKVKTILPGWEWDHLLSGNATIDNYRIRGYEHICWIDGPRRYDATLSHLCTKPLASSNPDLIISAACQHVSKAHTLEVGDSIAVINIFSLLFVNSLPFDVWGSKVV